MDNFSQIDFPLFLDRHLNFNRNETYTIDLVDEDDLKNQPIQNKNTKFGCIVIKEKESNLVMIKDKIGHLNLMFFYEGRWRNISKLSTEFSLDNKFIKSFNEHLDKVRRY